MRQLKMLKWQCFGLAEQRQRLFENWVRLKEENEKLRKVVTALEGQLRDMHIRMKNLVKGASKLEKELKELRDQGP